LNNFSLWHVWHETVTVLCYAVLLLNWHTVRYIMHGICKSNNQFSVYVLGIMLLCELTTGSGGKTKIGDRDVPCGYKDSYGLPNLRTRSRVQDQDQDCWLWHEDKEQSHNSQIYILYSGVKLCTFLLHFYWQYQLCNVQIMKDIANRYKLLQGYRIHYFPGWDCHGTPIEQKALAELRCDDHSLSALDLRNKGLISSFSFNWRD